MVSKIKHHLSQRRQPPQKVRSVLQWWKPLLHIHLHVHQQQSDSACCVWRVDCLKIRRYTVKLFLTWSNREELIPVGPQRQPPAAQDPPDVAPPQQQPAGAQDLPAVAAPQYQLHKIFLLWPLPSTSLQLHKIFLLWLLPSTSLQLHKIFLLWPLQM